MFAITVKRISKNDVEYLSSLLSETFVDNEAYNKFFKKYDSQKPNPIGTFSLISPDSKNATIIDYLRLGIIYMPFKFGISLLKKMLYLMRENKAVIERELPEKDWRY